MNIQIKQLKYSWRFRVFRTSERKHQDILKEGHLKTRKEAVEAANLWTQGRTRDGLKSTRRQVYRTERPWEWFVYTPDSDYLWGRSATRAEAEQISRKTAEDLWKK